MAESFELPPFPISEKEDVPVDVSFASVIIRENPRDKAEVLRHSNTFSSKSIDKRVPLHRFPPYVDDEVTDPSNIFEIDGVVARNIYMLGYAAHSNTSFSAWLYQKWRNAYQGNEQESKDNDTWETIMRGFDFVFILQFRNVNPALSSVNEMLCEDVFQKDEELSSVVNDILSSVKFRCLIIMDGLHEWNPNEQARKSLCCKWLPNIHVSKRTSCFFSMRPCVFLRLLKVVKRNDRILKIEGLIESKIVEVIKYVLSNNYELKEDPLRYQKVFDKIVTNMRDEGIVRCMKTPLLAAFCVHICYGEKQRGNSITSLYAAMIDMMLERAYKSHEIQIENDEVNDNEFKAILSGTTYTERYLPTLAKFGRIIALRTSYIFSKEYFIATVGLKGLHFGLNVGLVEEDDGRGSNTDILFLNEHVAMFLCAMSILTQKDIRQAFFKNAISVSDFIAFADAIMFVCGMSPNLGSLISHHVVSMANSAILRYREVPYIRTCVGLFSYKLEENTSALEMVEDLFELQVSWYREFRHGQTDRPSTFHVSDIYLTGMDSKGLCDKEAVRLTRYLLSDNDVDIKSLRFDTVTTDEENGITNKELNDFLSSKHKTRSLVYIFIASSEHNCRSINKINLPTLRFLHLRNIDVEYLALEDRVCAPLLNDVSELRFLELKCVLLGDKDIGISSDMSNLEMITLDNVKFSAKGWDNFISTLQNVQHEFIVNLYGCNIDENKFAKIESSVNFKITRFAKGRFKANQKLGISFKAEFARVWPVPES